MLATKWLEAPLKQQPRCLSKIMKTQSPYNDQITAMSRVRLIHTLRELYGFEPSDFASRTTEQLKTGLTTAQRSKINQFVYRKKRGRA